jgi:hypothetical protein
MGMVTDRSQLVTGLDLMCVGKHSTAMTRLMVMLDMAIVYSSL